MSAPGLLTDEDEPDVNGDGPSSDDNGLEVESEAAAEPEWLEYSSDDKSGTESPDMGSDDEMHDTEPKHSGKLEAAPALVPTLEPEPMPISEHEGMSKPDSSSNFDMASMGSQDLHDANMSDVDRLVEMDNVNGQIEMESKAEESDLLEDDTDRSISDKSADNANTSLALLQPLPILPLAALPQPDLPNAAECPPSPIIELPPLPLLLDMSPGEFKLYDPNQLTIEELDDTEGQCHALIT
ncbi:hypothetical protein H4S07_001143 [Coemansia furcata]|uniref:Uncharacterized protein n=1 Tax=Coemansia furcata TaxID=417177 RepID=A0ACC1LNA6_9FUNG|nr:hypothetical protein H4S07_001143 [Coemansia furcata]